MKILQICLKNFCESPPRSQFYQHVYVQLLHEMIPKAQKDSQVISVLSHFWDLSKKIAAPKMLVKLTTDVYFTNILQAAFVPMLFCQNII
jgi:hypothetical protein